MHRDVDRSLTGKIGRVTGRIGPGTIGEVMLPFRGGTSAFHAHPFDKNSVFAVGEQVLVIYYRTAADRVRGRTPGRAEGRLTASGR